MYAVIKHVYKVKKKKNNLFQGGQTPIISLVTAILDLFVEQMARTISMNVTRIIRKYSLFGSCLILFIESSAKLFLHLKWQ